MIWKQEGRCVCKTGMKYLEQEIFGLSEAFFKPHRCFLINLERVEKIGKKDVQPGQVLVFCGLAAGAEGFVFWNGIVTSVFLLLLARERGCLRLWCGLLLAAVYGLLCLFAEYFKASRDGDGENHVEPARGPGTAALRRPAAGGASVFCSGEHIVLLPETV